MLGLELNHVSKRDPIGNHCYGKVTNWRICRYWMHRKLCWKFPVQIRQQHDLFISMTELRLVCTICSGLTFLFRDTMCRCCYVIHVFLWQQLFITSVILWCWCQQWPIIATRECHYVVLPNLLMCDSIKSAFYCCQLMYIKYWLTKWWSVGP